MNLLGRNGPPSGRTSRISTSRWAGGEAVTFPGTMSVNKAAVPECDVYIYFYDSLVKS